MKTLGGIFLVLLFCGSSFALTVDEKLEMAKTRCQKEVKGEPTVFANDFKFGMDYEDVKSLYPEIYESGKRLSQRTFFVNNKFVFPEPSLSGTPKGVEIDIPDKFIKGIILQIETILKNRYAEFIFFPDLGHSHFFIEKSFYNKEIYNQVMDYKTRYEILMNHTELKVLYHTAEQIRLKDEDDNLVQSDWLRWRYYSRNPVADLDGKVQILFNSNDKFNTVRDFDEDHHYWGAGFNISASKNGCFPFEQGAEIKYFDISFMDLTYSPDYVVQEESGY